jgi:HlyD family secretion protein
MAAKLAELNAAVEQHRARLAELKRGPRSEQIDQARANLDGAERELRFRETELQRIRDVKERGLASAEALDMAIAANDAAAANVSLRRAQLEEQLAGTTVEELIQAEQLLIQAEARRDATALDVERHTIVAPVDGIADTRLFEAGERPLAGQPVFILLADAQAHARVFVPESMRVSVTPGMAASIHVDGLDAPLKGRVRWVASDPVFTPYYALTERDRKRLSYMAKIDIVDTRDRLPDGVPVEVTFE